MRDNPGVRIFTLQIFSDKNNVLVLNPNVENFGNIDVIELLSCVRLLLKLFARCLVDAGERNDLQGYGVTRAVIDRLVGDDRAEPSDFARRPVFLNTDTIMLGKSCWSHHVWASP